MVISGQQRRECRNGDQVVGVAGQVVPLTHVSAARRHASISLDPKSYIGRIKSYGRRCGDDRIPIEILHILNCKRIMIHIYSVIQVKVDVVSTTSFGVLPIAAERTVARLFKE